jgi:DNA-binding winged helix-turn-helix (wHTH) protein
MKFRFGTCVLDEGTREVSRDGATVHLSPKAYEFLQLLLQERPRAVSKEEIHQRLWPGTFVSDGTLTSLAAEARSAICDDARSPRFVRTVQRFGYAFSGPAEEAETAEQTPELLRQAWRLYWGAREIALEPGETILGRDRSATILVDHTSVSRRHARIRIASDQVTLEDLGSKNGTALRGEKIRSTVPLHDGDEIRVGSVTMTFRVFALSGSTGSATDG